MPISNPLPKHLFRSSNYNLPSIRQDLEVVPIPFSHILSGSNCCSPKALLLSLLLLLYPRETGGCLPAGFKRVVRKEMGIGAQKRSPQTLLVSS